MIELRSIEAEQTLAIRHQVLWPQHSPEFCRVAEDAQGWHIGGFVDHALVIVASVFFEQGQARLRKFACLPKHQGQGYGRQLLEGVIDELRAQADCSEFWCDARTSAIGFYQSLGFAVTSEVFDKHGVDYVKMSIPVSN